MRFRFWAISISLLVPIIATEGRQLPLTAKEISLMLRSGYSSETVLQDLAKRHFVDSLDLTNEKILTDAGASPSLINELKKGTYSVPPEEAARAKEQMEAQAKKRAAQAEEARKLDTLYRDQLAREHKRAGESNLHGLNTTYDYLKGSLVRPGPHGFIREDDDAIGKKKFILYYFSAHWCGPCRKFTPQLVDYYNQIAAQHPEFEIVFYSLDKSAADMENYMREAKMPWPAIDFEKLAEKAELKNTYGGGIPSLVLVESTGKLISSSYDGQKYVGTKKVLDDLNALFAGKFAQNQKP